MVRRGLLYFFTALTLAACQHAPSVTPAVLQDKDIDTMTALRAALAQSMDRATIELGAGDPTVTPSIAVLPPKPTTFETQSPALPTMFDLYMRGDDCFAMRRGDGAEIALEGVRCRPAI
ncbi:MAG: hypothetical protein HRT81_06015 [Henriciella sp.]|nr:hypothetical protein [Henriciella sp.]